MKLYFLFCGIFSTAAGFNIASLAHGVYSPSDTSSDNYFGFSVGIVYNKYDRSYYLPVGAPRSNTSSNPGINEPGALFKCDISRKDLKCNEVILDATRNNMRIMIENQNKNRNGYVISFRDKSWTGAALDVDSSEYTMVCSPRWQSKPTDKTIPPLRMNGYCSLLDSTLYNYSASSYHPLTKKEMQTYKVGRVNVYYNAFGGVGSSVHFAQEEDLTVLGAPSVLNWQGSAITMKKDTASIGEEFTYRDGVISYKDPFEPNPINTQNYGDFSYFGYAVTTGYFYVPPTGRRMMYVSGAPRAGTSHGMVFVYSLPIFSTASLVVLEERTGLQLGEYFGASVSAPDLNGDGLSELVVGAPHHSARGLPEMGAVYVFANNLEEKRLSVRPQIKLEGDKIRNARFGSAIANPGDLNKDGYQDLIIGAPYEQGEDGYSGSVYVYMGSRSGVIAKYSQRLVAKSVSPAIRLRGFGISFSRLRDVDNNDFPDVAIGSYQSSNVVMMLSRPVVTLRGSLKAQPETLPRHEKEFKLTACATYTGNAPLPDGIRMHISLRQHGSESETFVHFKDTRGLDHIEDIQIDPGSSTKCQEFDIEVKTEINTGDPVKIIMNLDIPTPPQPGPDIPMISPYSEEGVSSTRVSFVTGCEEDGNPTCRSDLSISTQLVGTSDSFLIGGITKDTLKITVLNLGEPAFLPEVLITVPSPVDFLPWRHDCDRHRQNSSILLTCRLGNPLVKDKPDSLEIDLDFSRLTDRLPLLEITTEAVSVADVEADVSDNKQMIRIRLEGEASIKATGWSNPEHILYERDGENTIKESDLIFNISHRSTITKKGITPISLAEVNFQYPAFYLAEDNKWRTLMHVKNMHILIDNNNYSCPIETPSTDRRITGRSRDFESDLYPISVIDCSSSLISCSEIKCLVGPWRKASLTVTLTTSFSVKIQDISEVISAKNGGRLESTLKAKFNSIHEDIEFNGNKEAITVIETFLMPRPLAGALEWWVYVLAVMGGFLLILLIAYGLYKIGFFQRQKLAELQAMQTHQATVLKGEEYED